MPDDPNVLFLFSDEHSFRCLGRRGEADGGEPVATPALDALADDGTEFTDSYCPMPLCTPSRLCTLTGREVPDAGAWGNNAVLPPERPTIAETLSGAGYETCLVGKMHLGGSRQYAGFDHRPYGDLTGATGHQWEPVDREGGRSIGDRIADAGVTEIPESQLQEEVTVRESLSWIREHEHASDDPWFLMASFSRPHFPLTAPRRYVERFWDLERDEPTDRLTEPRVGHEGDTVDHPMTVGAVEGFQTGDIAPRDQQRARACYFACVEYLDDLLGRFLDELERDGLLSDTVVVYASDHGELAGEHGLWWKHTWHEAAARIPMIVQTPAQRRGEAPATDLSTPASLLDVYPTVCGFAGAEAPDELDGVDLSAAVAAGEDPDRGPVVCDNPTDRWGAGTEFRAVRDGRYKYVAFRDAPELLFDLAADPLEQDDLAADPQRGAEASHALERLREYVDRTMDFDAVARERAEDDLHEHYPLDADEPAGSGNCYRIGDRIVDADAPLYRPHVVTDDPEGAFSDHPDRE
jgi:choline-sulfatase